MVDDRFLVVLVVVVWVPKKVWSPGSGCETWPETKLESFLRLVCRGIYIVRICSGDSYIGDVVWDDCVWVFLCDTAMGLLCIKGRRLFI